MKRLFCISMLLAIILQAPLLYAKTDNGMKLIDCGKTSLQGEIDKLDKFIANTLNFTGNCTEDISVSGFTELTLVGVGEASITATSFLPGDSENSTVTLSIFRSKVTLQTLTVNAGYFGVSCVRSTCILVDSIVQGGHNGVQFQDQSLGDIIGTSAIQDSLSWGLGVFGASSVNLRPQNGWPPGTGPGAVISGHYYGAVVLDGSFLRSDNATFTGNGVGIWVHRDGLIKIYGANGGVSDNTWVGVIIDQSSTGSIGVPVTNNGELGGVNVGPLSLFYDVGTTFSGNGDGTQNVICDHPTAISHPLSWCGH